MKNSSWQSSIIPVLLTGTGMLWVWLCYGMDFVMPVLFAIALASMFFRKTAKADDRIERLQQTLSEVAAGKLTGRITQIGEKDAIGELCWNINNVLDQIETSFREQETVFRMAGESKYFRKAQPNGLHGAYKNILSSANLSVDVMQKNSLIEAENLRTHRIAQEEIAELISHAAKGDFEKRLDISGKDGFFLDLANNLNRLMGTTEHGLQSVARVLRAIAEGDLTDKVEDDFEGLFDQIKHDTNATVDNLKDIVGQIKEASDAINIATTEIAAGNQDLADRTSRQADHLEKTSSSMEELNSTVKQNAENAKKANDLTLNANKVVKHGGEMVKNVAITMDDIQSSSKKIGDIVGIIDSIAFQTNILALNAAVEAARAGEQGRGFAVVATEVRNLAQRSAAAAKEIKVLINESVSKVGVGAKLVQQAGGTMDDVVKSFQDVATLVTEISHASREQSIGIEQVTLSVNQMDDATQQNAALVEQAAAAAENMEEQASHLVQSVGKFKLEKSGYPVRRAG